MKTPNICCPVMGKFAEKSGICILANAQLKAAPATVFMWFGRTAKRHSRVRVAAKQ